MISINPYFQYAIILKLLGGIIEDMSKSRLKLDAGKCLTYYEDDRGNRTYVPNGYRDDKAVNVMKKMFEAEAEQDMRAIFGPSVKKKTCGFCNGYGVWPGDEVPMSADELDWQLSDPCPKCDSNNHYEYMQRMGKDTEYESPPWKDNSIGFHEALKRFEKIMTPCVACSGTGVNSNGGKCSPCLKKNASKAG